MHILLDFKYIDSTIVNRKKHVNKYSNFSQKQLDPLEEAISNNEIKRKEKALENQSPNRGTTIPTTYGSTNTTKIFNISYNSIDSIIPTDPFTFGFTKIGLIIGPHGVKGELKVQLNTDFANLRIQPDTILYIKKPNRLTPRPIKVISGRHQINDIYLIHLENIRSRLSASSLKSYNVYVKSTDRPTLPENEYLIRDLVGLTCYSQIEFDQKSNDDNKSNNYLHPLAVVVGIIPPDELCDSKTARLMMHSMLEVRKAFSDDLCLIPFVPQIVTSVDLENKRMFLLPPDGLLDITYIELKKVVIRGYLPAVSTSLTEENRRYLMQESILQFSEGGQQIAKW